MEYKNHKRLDVYKKRLQKEITIPEDEIQRRMCWSKPILAENHKCSISLDLPVINCTPTKVCREVCYASQGMQFYRKAVVKSLAINRLIDDDPEHVARKMIDEAAGRAIRLAGSGDMLPQHKALVDYIDTLGGKWWGFTRRVDTHRQLSALMFSVDAATPTSDLQYVHDEVPVDRRAYLRRPEDPRPTVKVAVTFPVHGPWTNYVQYVPYDTNDCPAVRGKVEGCWRCKRCY